MDGGLTCADLQALYAEALTAARNCDINASGQCQQLVSSSLSVCPVCTTHVNDSSTLTAIKARWVQAGCDTSVAVICPQIACVQPGSAFASQSTGVAVRATRSTSSCQPRTKSAAGHLACRPGVLGYRNLSGRCFWAYARRTGRNRAELANRGSQYLLLRPSSRATRMA